MKIILHDITYKADIEVCAGIISDFKKYSRSDCSGAENGVIYQLNNGVCTFHYMAWLDDENINIKIMPYKTEVEKII